MEDLLTKIRADYPAVSFVEGTRFSWHAQKNHISYKKTARQRPQDLWALLHELGHALLGHEDYANDVDLLQMEVAAWHKAEVLAEQYQIPLDSDYAQDCLDTYRDWLHVRATCPTCYGRSLQTSPTQYRCFNCQTTWQVSRSRLCRPYRLQKTAA
jgi:hypothetical protein